MPGRRPPRFAVRRADDDERCGFVEPRGERWGALTLFGSLLGEHDGRDDAEAQVLAEGLASLAERWTLRRGDGADDDEVVCIQEVDADGVTVALGYYSVPGVPSRTITTAQLASGEWALIRGTTA